MRHSVIVNDKLRHHYILGELLGKVDTTIECQVANTLNGRDQVNTLDDSKTLLKIYELHNHLIRQLRRQW